MFWTLFGSLDDLSVQSCALLPSTLQSLPSEQVRVDKLAWLESLLYIGVRDAFCIEAMVWKDEAQLLSDAKSSKESLPTISVDEAEDLVTQCVEFGAWGLFVLIGDRLPGARLSKGVCKLEVALLQAMRTDADDADPALRTPFVVHLDRGNYLYPHVLMKPFFVSLVSKLRKSLLEEQQGSDSFADSLIFRRVQKQIIEDQELIDALYYTWYTKLFTHHNMQTTHHRTIQRSKHFTKQELGVFRQRLTIWTQMKTFKLLSMLCQFLAKSSYNISLVFLPKYCHVAQEVK